MNRNFKTPIKNLKWTGDITHGRTIEGWIYLAVVMDLYSRKIVGWSVSRNIDSALVCKALNNTIKQRNQSDYLLFHSDRGSQYSSDDFQDLLLSRGIESSMSLSGDPWNNAVQENFFQKLKHEFIRDRKSANFEDVRKELFWYIDLIKLGSHTIAPRNRSSIACYNLQLFHHKLPQTRHHLRFFPGDSSPPLPSAPQESASNCAKRLRKNT